MIKIFEFEKVDKKKIFSREDLSNNVSGAVSEIISNVKENGDKALLYYLEKFDKVKLDKLEVDKKEIDEAYKSVDKRFIEILKKSAENIKRFHSKQVRKDFKIDKKDGIVLGQRYTAIEKVGLYVPGGTASYPSTVLMDSIPAKIAGCKEIVMITPPSKDGKINPVILAAAKIAGIDRIFKVGGAQGIAALAYGTESIPKVYKIVGPGNAYVAEAKRQVYGIVSIDMIAGPSEILVIADKGCQAKNVAADLLSQAEHDKNATAVLITDSEVLAKDVQKELEKQIPLLERQEIARASIDGNGKIIIAKNLDVGIEIANEIAPEHLELCVDAPFEYLEKIKNAGSVFLGKNCPEALGDYFAGSNHTLPTSGSAKFSSPLSVDDFIKKTQYIYYDKQNLEKVNEDVAFFARQEGLTAHAKSLTIRFSEDE